MSRILFLTPQLPYPPHQGAAIRNLNLLKIAAQRHEVAVYSFVRSEAEHQAAQPLREWASEVRTFPAPSRRLAERAVQTALSPVPDMGRRLHSPEFARAVSQAGADIVQAEGIEMAQYLRQARGRTVFDCHNAEWVLQRRTFELDLRRGRPAGAAYSLLQWLKLRRYERAACQAAGAVVAVSTEDRCALHDLDQRLAVRVVPNGVDAASFAPPSEPPRPNSFLFTGTLDFRPNVDAVLWLARDIWPRIRDRLPAAELTLAGRAPIPAIQRLHGRDGITVAVSPDDIRPYFASSAVYLVPVRAGGGSRYKLLQAMSMGMGIVSTSLGAEGVAAAGGEHLLLADSPAEMAAAAVALAGDAAWRRRLGLAARDLVLSTYDWPVLAPGVLAVYDRLLPPAGAPSPAPSGEGIPTPPEPEPVSVVLTVLNEAAGIGPLIEDLLAQDQPAGEILVVDGGSTDGTQEVVARYSGLEPEVRLIAAPGTNISQGRNRGLAEARHDIVAVTDAGVRLGPGWLRLITEPPRRREADVVAGFFEADPHSPFETVMGATVLPRLEDIDPACFLPSSRSIAFRKCVWQRAGGYPEWLDYCEDLIFDLNLRAAGVRLAFEPAAMVRFRPRSTLRAFFRQYYRYARGDGKADLWRARHALRYLTYLHLVATLACLLTPAGRRHRRAAGYFATSSLLGGLAYLWKPLRRLRALGRGASTGEWLFMLALLPVIRLTGDVAKMAGYPAGWWWRVRHKPADWRR